MKIIKNISFGERIIWVAVALLLIYATITGTNWYHQYHEYKTVAEKVDDEAIIKADSYDKLKTDIEILQGELKDKNATIEQLKQIPLR